MKLAHPASESTELGLSNWNLSVRSDTRQAAVSFGLEKGLASYSLIVPVRVMTKARQEARTEQEVTRTKMALDYCFVQVLPTEGNGLTAQCSQQLTVAAVFVLACRL